MNRNAPLKRINPRRPFMLTPDGLRRVMSGAPGAALAVAASGKAPLKPNAPDVPGGHGQAASKPRRQVTQPRHALLVALHSERGALDDHACQALAAAALMADSETQVVLLVFGELKDDAAALGADQIIVLPGFDTRIFAPQHELQMLAACVEQVAPRHILMPDNSTGDGDLGRRYAARARLSIACHGVELGAQHIGVRLHAKRAFATRAWPKMILLEAGAVDSRLPFVGAGERIELATTVGSGTQTNRDRHHACYFDEGIDEIDAAQVALEEADFIVSAGHGVTDVALFETLAGKLGAAMGASRVAVDNGLFARDRQIGATGKTVSASVYLAFGISGAVQHLQGIKDCRHVIAVNLDRSAPMVKRANLAIVDDAQATMASLLDMLAKDKGQAQDHAPCADECEAQAMVSGLGSPPAGAALPLLLPFEPDPQREGVPA